MTIILDRFALILGIEYAWNIFPSTPLSSSVLVGANALLLAGIWFGYAEGKSTMATTEDQKIKTT
jgi:alpha-1,3-mannosyltransferase